MTYHTLLTDKDSFVFIENSVDFLTLFFLEVFKHFLPRWRSAEKASNNNREITSIKQHSRRGYNDGSCLSEYQTYAVSLGNFIKSKSTEKKHSAMTTL